MSPITSSGTGGSSRGCPPPSGGLRSGSGSDSISSVFRKLLGAKGVHFLVTRFGSEKLRRVAFDDKYRRGVWAFDGDGSGELPEVVKRYLRKGDLLVLGCGRASVLDGLSDADLT